MFKKVKIAFGLDPIHKQLDRYTKSIDEINQLEETYEKLTDEELKSKTVEYRQRLENGEALDDLLPGSVCCSA